MRDKTKTDERISKLRAMGADIYDRLLSQVRGTTVRGAGAPAPGFLYHSGREFSGDPRGLF